MSLSYTLTTLKAAIVEWLEDDGAEFQAGLDNLIKLSEQQIVKDLPFSIFEDDAAVSITAGAITKPSDLVSVINIFCCDTGPTNCVLMEPKPWDYVIMLGGTATNAIYYAEQDPDTLIVAPVPTGTKVARIRYIQRPVSLVDVAEGTTTWISKNIAEVLFWACIANAENFRKADNRIEMAKANYAESVAKAMQELSHLIRKTYR